MPATVRRYLATIGKAHRIHHLEDPTKDELVRLTAEAFFRGRGDQGQAAPIHWEDVEKFGSLKWADVRGFLAKAKDESIADQVRTALRGEKQLLRAKALLLVGYNTMARREELVALDLADITFEKPGDGVATIRKGKTDQGRSCNVYDLGRSETPFKFRGLQKADESVQNLGVKPPAEEPYERLHRTASRPA